MRAWPRDRASHSRRMRRGRSPTGSGSGPESEATRSRVEIGGVTRTYAELDDVTDRTAAGFAALGLDPGEHVSLMMQNSIENIDAWFGLPEGRSRRGPDPHRLARGGLLQYIVDHADARALVIDEAFLPHLAAVADGVPQLEHVIVNRNEPGEGPTDPSSPAGSRSTTWRSSTRAGGRPAPELSRQDTAVSSTRRARPGRRRASSSRTRRPPPHPPPRLADGLHERRPPLHRLPALPQQREVHERAAPPSSAAARS